VLLLYCLLDVIFHRPKEPTRSPLALEDIKLKLGFFPILRRNIFLYTHQCCFPIADVVNLPAIGHFRKSLSAGTVSFA